MQIKALIQESALRLKEVTDIPQKEAMVLLSRALGKDMSWLITHDQEEVNVDTCFEVWMQRRAAFEPLEYILGSANFYDRTFIVDSRVLIPRPETEILVDKAIELATVNEYKDIVEIGTGSGIISIMLALMLPQAKITAIDISHDALDIARRNATLHHVEDRIVFVQGSYFAKLDIPMDMAVSNPPYIANDEVLGKGLAFEPSLALYGGKQGDEMLCHIIDEFMERQIKALACEMGYDQRSSLTHYAHRQDQAIEFYQDLAGLDRGFWMIKEKK